MDKELMITKEDLVSWLDRPPSNDDLDLIGFITTRLENFYKLEQENKQLKEDKKKAREFIYRYWITYDESKNFIEFNEEMNILIKDIKKLLELLGDGNNE